MGVLKLIIKREFIAKVRNKSFIIMTFLSPLLFVALGAVVAYLGSMESDVKRIAVKDDAGFYFNHFKDYEEYHFVNASSFSVEALKDSIDKQRFEGVLLIPQDDDVSKINYISNESPGLGFLSHVESVIAARKTKSNLISSGIDTTAIRNANAKVSIGLSKATGEKTVEGLRELKVIIGSIAGYLIMMFIVIYGNMVMRSVIEEKTSRIIEIIISSVKPFQLMLGKIIGTSLAGVLQFTIWAILGFALMSIGSILLGIDAGPGANVATAAEAAQSSGLDIKLYIAEWWNLPLVSIVLGFVVYFIGGYFLYSSFYAAIGAAVDNETDSQQFLLPIIMPLILGVYIGLAAVLKDPHGTIAVIFSMVPLTSPIVMLMRIPFGVPWWQLAISVGILFATFLIVVWFAAKIYRVGILMHGKKPTWREIIKWMRY
jgi:ABC-2 type transport system permease protein